MFRAFIRCWDQEIMVDGRCDDNPDSRTLIHGVRIETRTERRRVRFPPPSCFVPVFVPDGGGSRIAFITKLRRGMCVRSPIPFRAKRVPLKGAQRVIEGGTVGLVPLEPSIQINVPSGRPGSLLP